MSYNMSIGVYSGVLHTMLHVNPSTGHVRIKEMTTLRPRRFALFCRQWNWELAILIRSSSIKYYSLRNKVLCLLSIVRFCSAGDWSGNQKVINLSISLTYLTRKSNRDCESCKTLEQFNFKLDPQLTYYSPAASPLKIEIIFPNKQLSLDISVHAVEGNDTQRCTSSGRSNKTRTSIHIMFSLVCVFYHTVIVGLIFGPQVGGPTAETLSSPDGQCTPAGMLSLWFTSQIKLQGFWIL